ncbi:hypothetical protein SAMN02745704_01911 [Paucidesulfovibrio gracilis DSM 16080]|uniref:Uncharacterized protein n=1 Tax=Paucidesulfovibrio gracilis DSM 16080 TaxID=1121449 RepID=A0A1T4X965_9BACT|nr:hypothetical protein [Paucidesulfovibrio gracilis]SKA85648.1 hypothetical protein SAMN02745704_01911 [Paucidesulfovibrio gracilis DSM 16080]
MRSSSFPSGAFRRNPVRSFVLALLLTLCTSGLWGCATGGSHPLLQHDPTEMTDAGVRRYLHDLDRAIVECDTPADTRPDIAVGAGTSTGGGSMFGISLSQPVGQRCDSGPLRQRREQTLRELRERGITP